MRASGLWLLLAALSLPTAAQDYFPLGDDDVWEYGVIYYPPGVPPDTSRSAPVRVTERVTVNDTAYAVVDLPFVPADTLRTDFEGRVWGRIHGQDLLLLDVTRSEGETYSFPWRSYGGIDLTYEVAVWRPLTVDVPAGRFENVIVFSFDVPTSHDEEMFFALAPDVGIVYASGNGGSYQELFTAEIGGRFYTDTEPAPMRVAARAFPNPASGAVTVELAPGRWASAEVVDVLGRRVATLDVGACGGATCTLRWDAADRPAGLYVVRAEGASGRVSLPVTLAR